MRFGEVDFVMMTNTSQFLVRVDTRVFEAPHINVSTYSLLEVFVSQCISQTLQKKDLSKSNVSYGHIFTPFYKLKYLNNTSGYLSKT